MVQKGKKRIKKVRKGTKKLKEVQKGTKKVHKQIHKGRVKYILNTMKETQQFNIKDLS